MHSSEWPRSGLFKYILAEKFFNQETHYEEGKDTDEKGVGQVAIRGWELSCSCPSLTPRPLVGPQ